MTLQNQGPEARFWVGGSCQPALGRPPQPAPLPYRVWQHHTSQTQGLCAELCSGHSVDLHFEACIIEKLPVSSQMAEALIVNVR